MASQETRVIKPSELNTPKNKRAISDISDESGENPIFPALMLKKGGRIESKRVSIPLHRLGPLREKWMQIYDPIVTHMRLQVRMNTKSKAVELRTSEHTDDVGALQKAVDFLRAFVLGFEVNDAVALLRLDDLFIDSFEIHDVKMLQGDNLSRAIGRIVGKDGKTRFTIENTTRTRIIVADSHIHILGSFNNIKVARDSIVSLILGSPPGKVYAKLQSIAWRVAERF